MTDPWFWLGWVMVICLATLFVAVTWWALALIVRAIREATAVVEAAPVPPEKGPKLRRVDRAS